MTPRWICLLMLLLAGSNLPAQVGVVDTFTRESFEGHIRFESNLIVVVSPDQGRITRVPLTNLAGLFFKPEKASASHSAATGMVFSAESALPGQWREERIALPSDIAGYTTLTNGLFRLHCGGAGIGSQSDSFQFLCKPVRGDSEIVVRIVLLERGGPEAIAGLMIRRNLEPDSPGVMLALTPARGGRLLVRENSGEPAVETPLPGLRGPCWLKLRREGRVVTAWRSSNGRGWRVLRQLAVPMGEEVFVGVAASANRTDRLMRVTFDQLLEAPSLPANGFIPRLELPGGSLVNGPLLGADETEMRFPDPLTRLPLSTHLVANIRFQWVPERWTRRLAAGKPGVLLRSGEFIEGDFQGIDGHQIAVSSILTGQRRFDVNHDVIAAVLRPARRAPARCEVRDAAGSVWRGSDLTIVDNEVVLREAALGVQRIPIFALAELRVR